MDDTIRWYVEPVLTYEVRREQGGKVERRRTLMTPEAAHEVAKALCSDEHRRLGWPVDDLRIQYPQTPKPALRLEAVPVVDRVAKIKADLAEKLKDIEGEYRREVADIPILSPVEKMLLREIRDGGYTNGDRGQ